MTVAAGSALQDPIVGKRSALAMVRAEDVAPFPLTAVDKELWALNDDHFEPHTWDEIKQIIGVICSQIPREHFAHSDSSREPTGSLQAFAIRSAKIRSMVG